MRNRVRRSHAGRRIASPSVVGTPAGDPRVILTITNYGGLALVKTQAPHELGGGETISILDTSGETYDGGPYEVTRVSTTTFTFGQSYTSDSTGGSYILFLN